MFRKKPAKPVGRQRPTYSADRPSAFSYYARRSDELLNTGREIARTETAAKARDASRFWRQRFGLAIGLVVASIGLIYISNLATSPRLVVRTTPSQAVLRDPAVYQAAASELLSRSVLNRNKITVSTASVARQLKAEFPELAQVEISLPLLAHQPVIYITAAQPVMLLVADNGTFALNSAGQALVSGSQLTQLNSLHLPLVTDQTGVTIKLHQPALTTADVGFITTVLAQHKARKLSIASLTLPAGTRELSVRLEGQPYMVRYNLAANTARQQVGTFLAVYDRLNSQQVVPGQYIDVRVDGRAYYK